MSFLACVRLSSGSWARYFHYGWRDEPCALEGLVSWRKKQTVCRDHWICSRFKACGKIMCIESVSHLLNVIIVNNFADACEKCCESNCPIELRRSIFQGQNQRRGRVSIAWFFGSQLQLLQFRESD